MRLFLKVRGWVFGWVRGRYFGSAKHYSNEFQRAFYCFYGLDGCYPNAVKPKIGYGNLATHCCRLGRLFCFMSSLFIPFFWNVPGKTELFIYYSINNYSA